MAAAAADGIAHPDTVARITKRTAGTATPRRRPEGWKDVRVDTGQLRTMPGAARLAAAVAALEGVGALVAGIVLIVTTEPAGPTDGMAAGAKVLFGVFLAVIGATLLGVAALLLMEKRWPAWVLLFFQFQFILVPFGPWPITVLIAGAGFAAAVVRLRADHHTEAHPRP